LIRKGKKRTKTASKDFETVSADGNHAPEVCRLLKNFDKGVLNFGRKGAERPPLHVDRDTRSREKIGHVWISQPLFTPTTDHCRRGKGYERLSNSPFF
jgi:hypothetical protein